jgi:hypothetical protein
MGTKTQGQPLRPERSPHVAGRWANTTNGQEVTITVTKVPTQTCCYDIELRATIRQSTK